MESEPNESLNVSTGNEAASKNDDNAFKNEEDHFKLENNSLINSTKQNDDNSNLEKRKQKNNEEEEKSLFDSSLGIEENNADSLSIGNLNSDLEKELDISDDLEQVDVSKLQYTIETQKDQILQLKEEKKAIQTKLSNMEEFCQFLQTQKSSLQNKVKSLSNKNSQLQAEINKLKASNSNNNSNDNNNSSNDNNGSNNNNAILAHFQKENQNLLDEYQQLSNKYLELKAQTRNQQHNNNSEMQKKLAEISKLQSDLQEKNNEVDNLKRSNDRNVKKLQQEIDRLKTTEDDLRREIQLLGKKPKLSPKATSDDNIVELKKQNEILKRKNDLISQNFELERIELQTMLDQKEIQIKSLNVKLSSKSSNNEISASSSSKSIELLRAENKQLKEKIYSLSPLDSQNFSSSLAMDKFKSKTAKINLTIYRQFSKINSKMLTLNSKISLLQYRLKMKKKRNNDLINDQQLYYVRYTPQRSRKYAAIV